MQNFVEVADDAKPADFALDYEALVERRAMVRQLKIERSPEDEFFIYTGGTTGMPKGVIWTHDDLRETSLVALRKLGPVPENTEQVIEAIRTAGPGNRMIPACPLDAWHRPPDGVEHDAGRRPRHHAATSLLQRAGIVRGGTEEQGDYTWAEAVTHLSGHAARRYRLTDRGMIRPGFAADIAVFDPARHHRPIDLRRLAGARPRGWRMSLVNGQLVLKDGEPTGATPGRALRRG